MPREVYINMIDKFLSGWGRAAKGRSLYSVRCENRAQADAIEKAARERPEMKNITMSERPPRPRPGDVLTVRAFADLGAVWTKYHPAR